MYLLGCIKTVMFVLNKNIRMFGFYYLPACILVVLRRCSVPRRCTQAAQMLQFLHEMCLCHSWTQACVAYAASQLLTIT